MVIIAMTEAAILQTFFPTFLGRTTDYGMNAGMHMNLVGALENYLLVALLLLSLKIAKSKLVK